MIYRKPHQSPQTCRHHFSDPEISIDVITSAIQCTIVLVNLCHIYSLLLGMATIDN